MRFSKSHNAANHRRACSPNLLMRHIRVAFSTLSNARLKPQKLRDRQASFTTNEQTKHQQQTAPNNHHVSFHSNCSAPTDSLPTRKDLKYDRSSNGIKIPRAHNAHHHICPPPPHFVPVIRDLLTQTGRCDPPPC
jgi:hypothetical protein